MAIGGVGVIVLAVGLALFQPWKLFLNVEVDEAIPVASGPAPTDSAADATGPSVPTSPEGAGTTTTVAPGPVTLSVGAFVSHDHPTAGTAKVLEVDGQQFVRFEDLVTDNGPDLIVVLSRNEASSPDVGDDYLDLGALKGNIGNQNYEIPEGVDVADYRSVAVWCRRFSVSFGAAPLELG